MGWGLQGRVTIGDYIDRIPRNEKETKIGHMTVHFFTYGNESGGSSRQRAFRVADELNARGVTAVVHRPSVVSMSTTPWPKKFLCIVAVINSLRSVQKGDVIFLQRAVGNKYFFIIMVAYLLFFRRKMIFDFDDAIYMNDPFKTKTLTRMADAVVVCSKALDEWARQYNKNVHIMHTSLKYSAYEKFTKDYSHESKPIVIGWVGTAPEHIYNLEILASVFKKLLKKTPGLFKFVLIGALQYEKVYALFQSIPGLNVEVVDSLDWNDPESVPRVIQTFDIGVMPLFNKNEWNLARSSFKPLEYMACGVVAVCSGIGEITHVIQDGVNGYLVDTEDNWVERLEKLISDAKLRATLGSAGQEYVRDNDCYEVIIPRMATICNSFSL